MDAAPRTVRYARHFFYQRGLGLLAVAAVVLVMLGTQTRTPPEWVAVIGAALLTYVAVVGFSPILTVHTLTRSRLILRQGWYFRCIVPLADAESIGPFDGDPKFGLRISIRRRLLYVVGSAHDLVAVRLREPRRFAQVLFLRADTIVFDADDRDALLAAVADRQTAGEPLPARKVYVLPARR